MLRTRFSRLLLGAVLTLALPGAAIAARPMADATYAQIKHDKQVINIHVAKTHRTIDSVSAYTKCNPVPFNPPLKIKVNKAGAFSLKGKRKDVLGHRMSVVLKGKFVNSTHVRGSYRISTGKGKKRCNSKTVKFSATLVTSDSAARRSR